jgi:hypothetical protein
LDEHGGADLVRERLTTTGRSALGRLASAVEVEPEDKTETEDEESDVHAELLRRLAELEEPGPVLDDLFPPTELMRESDMKLLLSPLVSEGKKAELYRRLVGHRDLVVATRAIRVVHDEHEQYRRRVRKGLLLIAAALLIALVRLTLFSQGPTP